MSNFYEFLVLNENKYIRNEYLDELNNFFNFVSAEDQKEFKFRYFLQVVDQDPVSQISKKVLRKEYDSFISSLRKSIINLKSAFAKKRPHLNSMYKNQNHNLIAEFDEKLNLLIKNSELLELDLKYDQNLNCPKNNIKFDPVFELYADLITTEFQKLLAKNQTYTNYKFTKRSDNYRGVFENLEGKGLSETPTVTAEKLTAIALQVFKRPSTETQIKYSTKKTQLARFKSMKSLTGKKIKK